MEYAGKSCSIRQFSAVKTFPIAADLVCTQDTLKWLAFEPDSCDLNRSATFVHTSSLNTASALQNKIDGEICASGNGFAWGIYKLLDSIIVDPCEVGTTPNWPETRSKARSEPNTSSRYDRKGADTGSFRQQYKKYTFEKEELEQFSHRFEVLYLVRSYRQKYPHLIIEEVASGLADVVSRDYRIEHETVTVRFLPDGLFNELVHRLDRSLSLRSKPSHEAIPHTKHSHREFSKQYSCTVKHY